MPGDDLVRILMLSDFYPPIVGGMEKNVQSLAQGLVHEGHNVVVCTTYQNGLSTFSEKKRRSSIPAKSIFQRAPLLFSDSAMKFHPPYADCLLTRKIRQIVHLEQPDLITVHGWILFSVLPFKDTIDVPVFAVLHDLGLVCPKRSLRKREEVCSNSLNRQCISCGAETYGSAKSILTYLALKSSKLLQAKGMSSIQYLYTTPNIGYRLGLDRTRFLPRPIDTEIYKPIKNLEYDDRILCWVSMYKQKGVDTIFEVADRLPNYKFDIPFVGDEKDYYRKLKPHNITFLPPPEDIPNLIGKYPIVLGQFLQGVIGGSELEAMACGKPVIAYWNRKYDQFYDDPCPIISSREVSEISDLIKTFKGNKEIGETSSDWVIKYHSTPKIVDRLLSIYKSVLQVS